MIYLIISEDIVTINEHLNKILKNNNGDIIKYDAEVTDIDNIINDLDTYDLFGNKKTVIVSNCFFLDSIKKKEEVPLDRLLKYIDNPNGDNILILITSKVDERKAIVKKLRKNVEVIEKDISINDIVKKNLEDYQMDNLTINFLIDYCCNDNEKILNELEKLKSYKFHEKIITKNDIEEVVKKDFNDNVFSLTNAIMSKNKKKSINLYQELLDNGEDINKIVALLEDQFRLIYSGRILLKEHNNNYDEVAKILKVHPYRLQKVMNSSYNYSSDDVLKILSKLIDMEIAIKTGNQTVGMFEVFIYEL